MSELLAIVWQDVDLSNPDEATISSWIAKASG